MNPGTEITATNKVEFQPTQMEACSLSANISLSTGFLACSTGMDKMLHGDLGHRGHRGHRHRSLLQTGVVGVA